MKNLILAAFAALSLGAIIAPAANAASFNAPGRANSTNLRGDNSTITKDAQATRMQQTGSYSR